MYLASVTEQDFLEAAKRELSARQTGTTSANVATDLDSIVRELTRYEGDIQRARTAIANAGDYSEAKSKINALRVANA